MAGTRPVVEMRFADFALCAVDELINQAAKARYMLGGQVKVPMVIREPMGMWRSSAAQHSQSLESWYTHIPGLVVVVPSTPADNRGLLKTAIRSDDPVVYLEHKNIWGYEGDVPEDETLIPFGRGRLEKEGDDITIVSWSAQMHIAANAATLLQVEGISAELIDLRTLWPWDRQMVFDSVGKTGRLLITHESVSVGGFGAEIAATVAEQLFSVLKSPITRCAAPRVPISYAPPLEAKIRVSSEQIVKAARKSVAVSAGFK